MSCLGIPGELRKVKFGALPALEETSTKGMESVLVSFHSSFDAQQ